MYFVILGKHQDISLAELQLCQPEVIDIAEDICVLKTEHPHMLSRLGGIIKW